MLNIFIMKPLFLSLIFCFNFLVANAQNTPVPTIDEMQNIKNWDEYDKRIVPIVDWLDKIDIVKDSTNYKLACALMVAWATNSSKVTVELDNRVADFVENAPDLLIYFMAGWIKEELIQPGQDKVMYNLAGIEKAIALYKRQQLPKNKRIEKLIALQEKKELRAAVEERLKSK